MYDELVKDLRYLAKVYSICENENMQEYKLAVKAADAIEELSVVVRAQKAVLDKFHRQMDFRDEAVAGEGILCVGV